MGMSSAAQTSTHVKACTAEDMPEDPPNGKPDPIMLSIFPERDRLHQ